MIVQRLRLVPEFRTAIRSSGFTQTTLAAAAGFSACNQLSNLLNAPRITATPLTMQRLQVLANFIGYSGEVVR